VNDIKKLIKEKESRKLEFKRELPSKDKIIKTAIFDDMIEITSPGIFLIDKEDIGNGCSELRNQNLGNLLRQLNIIEQWGTGFEKIKNELKEYPEIEFELIDNSSSFTQVRFVKKDILVGINVGVNDVLDIIQKQQPINAKDITKYFNVAQRTIERYIKELKKQDKIEFIGSSKTGGYYAK
jgi:ATP-dependent DNA helicase RecG